MLGRMFPILAVTDVLSAVLFGQSQPPPAFEVVLVKPTSPDSRDSISLFTSPGGRITITKFTLRMLIQVAYGINKYQVSGGQRWVDEDRFDIVAKPPES